MYHQPPLVIQMAIMAKLHHKPQLSQAVVLENSASPLNRHQSPHQQLQSQRYLKNSTLLLKDESLCKLKLLIGIESLPPAPLLSRRRCGPGESGSANESANEKEKENENESLGTPLKGRKWRLEHGRL